MEFLWILFALLVASFMMGGYFFVRAARWKQAKVVRARFDHGVQSESKAESILKKEGYELLSSQETLTLSMFVDGALRTYKVRPDGVAHKNGQTFLVEIKTGKKAVNPVSGPTRRQLLEYSVGGGVPGVLLLNADEESVQLIQFGSSTPIQKAPPPPPPLPCRCEEKEEEESFPSPPKKSFLKGCLIGGGVGWCIGWGMGWSKILIPMG